MPDIISEEQWQAVVDATVNLPARQVQMYAWGDYVVGLDGWGSAPAGFTLTHRNESWDGLEMVRSSGSTTPGYALRTVTGLTIGRTYTFTAEVARSASSSTVPTTARIGATGFGVPFGTAGTIPVGVSVNYGPSAYVKLSYIFVATATSHQLRIEYALSGAGTGVLATGVEWTNMLLMESAPAGPAVVKTQVVPEEARCILDQSWAPYGQGNAVVPMDQISVDGYDPRQATRITVGARRAEIDVNGYEKNISVRSFDLGVRSRSVREKDQRVELHLATDEALLQDRIATADDDYNADFNTDGYSLRTMIKRLLTEYLNTTLLDQDFTTNLIPNPKMATVGSGVSGGLGGPPNGRQTTGGPSVTPNWYRVSNNSGSTQPTMLAFGNYIPTVQGRGHRFGSWYYSTTGGPTEVYLFWYSAVSVQVGVDYSVVNVPANTWVWIEQAAVSDLGTAFVRWAVNSLTPMPNGGYLGFTGMILSPSDEPLPGFWDGSTAAGGGFTYGWNGTADSSSSYRRSTAAIVDKTVIPRESAMNLIPNPNFRTSIGNWIAGGANGVAARLAGAPTSPPYAGITAYSRTTWSGASGTGVGGIDIQGGTVAPYILISENTPYHLSVWVRSSVAKSGSDTQIRINYYDSNGVAIPQRPAYGQNGVALPANTWVRRTLTDTSPVGAVRASVSYRATGLGSWAAGNTLDTTGWMLVEGFADPLISSTDVPFDGTTTTTSEYAFAWTGAANASPAERTALVDRPRETYKLKAGDSIWDFMAPWLSAAGFRLFCDEKRVWRMVDTTYRVEGLQSLTSSVNVDGDDSISRDDDTWADYVVLRYTWIAANGNTTTKTESAGTTTGYSRKGVLIDYDYPYPGPGAAALILARMQQRGREQSVEALVDFAATPSKAVYTNLPGLPAANGVTQAVTFDSTQKTMYLVARDLVDVV